MRDRFHSEHERRSAAQRAAEDPTGSDGPAYTRTFDERTTRDNVLALVCLAGLALSILALCAGVAGVLGLWSGFTLGVVGPALALLVFGLATWRQRSRR